MNLDSNYIEKKILKKQFFTSKELSYFLNLDEIKRSKDLKLLNALLKLNDLVFERKKLNKKKFKKIEKSLLFQLKKILEYKIR